MKAFSNGCEFKIPVKDNVTCTGINSRQSKLAFHFLCSLIVRGGANTTKYLKAG